MEIGSCVKCAETFSACGCGSKAAEDAPIPSDPRVSPMADGLHIPANSPALDLPRENAEIGGVDFKADSSPLPPDPRVSPLNEGLYTPSDTPEMAAEMKDSHLTVSQRVLRAVHDQYPALYEDIEEGTQFPPEELDDTGDYDDAVDIAETMQLVRLLSADIRNASEPIKEFYDITKTYPRGVENEMYAESFEAENNTKFELLGSKYIEGVGIVTEGSPYLKNYYGEMDEYNIYDDDAAEIIMSIPVNDARFPLKGGEIELIRAMVYGFEHPRINDSWGELNEDGMFWTTKVMETLANYDSSEAESFGAERRYVVAGQKLAIIYRIDRDDKTADILGVLPSYAEGKKAMTYMFKSALEEYSEYSEEDLMSFSDGKKEFAWYESRSKKKKSLDFYHPTGYEDIIIVLKEFRIKTLTDFYDMINEGKFSAETFNAESFGAESKFDKLAKEIAEEYEEKGKSPKEAMEIGEATAAKIGRAKFGKRKFAKMGKKAEDDIDFDEAKADRNKDGRISDWERAVGNKVAKGIRESKRAEVGPHVPTRIAATTTPRGVVKTYTSIPAGDGHVVGQFTPDMDYAPSGMYGAESLTSSIEKGFGAVLGIMSGLIVGGFAMGAVSSLSKDDENRE